MILLENRPLIYARTFNVQYYNSNSIGEVSSLIVHTKVFILILLFSHRNKRHQISAVYSATAFFPEQEYAAERDLAFVTENGKKPDNRKLRCMRVSTDELH